MNHKAILASLLTIGLAATMLGVGTMAYFSDTEESTGNTFTAGVCDIELSAGSDANAFLTADNMKPGDSVTGTIIITVGGTVDIKYLPMGCEITSGYYTELADYLIVDYMEAWYKTDDVWFGETGDYSADSTLKHFCDNRYKCDPCDDSWLEPSTAPDKLEPGDEVKITFTITFPDDGTDQNDAQGDSVTIKFTFAGYTDYPCP